MANDDAGMSGLDDEEREGMVDKIAALTPEEGAQTIIYLASSPEVAGVSGRYFAKEQSFPSSKQSYDLAFCRQLWEVSVTLTGLANGPSNLS